MLPGGCIDGFFHDFRFPEFPDRILGFVPVRRQRRVRVGRHAHARPFGDIRRYLPDPLQGHQLDRGEHRQGKKRRRRAKAEEAPVRGTCHTDVPPPSGSGGVPLGFVPRVC